MGSLEKRNCFLRYKLLHALSPVCLVLLSMDIALAEHKNDVKKFSSKLVDMLCWSTIKLMHKQLFKELINMFQREV